MFGTSQGARIAAALWGHRYVHIFALLFAADVVCSLGDIKFEVRRRPQRGQSVSAVNCGMLCGVRLRLAVKAACIIILQHSSGAWLFLVPAS